MSLTVKHNTSKKCKSLKTSKELLLIHLLWRQGLSHPMKLLQKHYGKEILLKVSRF